uniref:Uncharacterized protein n=1 Tax=Romanomermis culicivorax TaxID=13658 RepID=A0A915JTV3_ROMCU
MKLLILPFDLFLMMPDWRKKRKIYPKSRRGGRFMING